MNIHTRLCVHIDMLSYGYGYFGVMCMCMYSYLYMHLYVCLYTHASKMHSCLSSTYFIERVMQFHISLETSFDLR